MPIYEYECTGCHHKLDAFQKMTDAPLTDCPHCHKGTLQKLVSAAGFQLKGTGWYATDFKTKKDVKQQSQSEGTADHTADKKDTSPNAGSNPNTNDTKAT